MLGALFFMISWGFEFDCWDLDFIVKINEVVQLYRVVFCFKSLIILWV